MKTGTFNVHRVSRALDELADAATPRPGGPSSDVNLIWEGGVTDEIAAAVERLRVLIAPALEDAL